MKGIMVSRLREPSGPLWDRIQRVLAHEAPGYFELEIPAKVGSVVLLVRDRGTLLRSQRHVGGIEVYRAAEGAVVRGTDVACDDHRAHGIGNSSRTS